MKLEQKGNKIPRIFPISGVTAQIYGLKSHARETAGNRPNLLIYNTIKHGRQAIVAGQSFQSRLRI